MNERTKVFDNGSKKIEITYLKISENSNHVNFERMVENFQVPVHFVRHILYVAIFLFFTNIQYSTPIKNLEKK